MHFDAEFYVALGFIIFVLLLAYLGVHKQLTKALDDRSRKVADELAQAKKLHDEAGAVLATFKRKAAAAEAEAAAIVAQARSEAEMMAKETEARMAEFVTRRTKQAEAKIAMAETQAASDVRAAAADLAVKTAEIVFRRNPQETGAAGMVEREIERLKARLH
jgi:F-type H+-transporting ATPase subunit b